MNQRNGVTGTSVIQEYSKNNIYIATENIPRSVAIGLDKMVSYLKIKNKWNGPTWMITKDCKNLIREMKRYHWETFRSSKMTEENNAKQVPKKER